MPTAHDQLNWQSAGFRDRRFFHLFATYFPSGGLLIEARDVNGDHSVDLILSTAWLSALRGLLR